jgi:hypothetical protein
MECNSNLFCYGLFRIPITAITLKTFLRLHTYERLDAPKKINWREFFLLFDETS